MSVASTEAASLVLQAVSSRGAAVLAERLSAACGVRVEVRLGAAAGEASGPGLLVRGFLPASRTRFNGFLGDSAALALAGAVIGRSVGTMEEAGPALDVIASEIAEAVGACVGSASGSVARLDGAGAAAAPPESTPDRVRFSVRIDGVTALLTLDLVPESVPADGRPSDVLLDLELPFAITLGSVEMELGQVQQLETGSILPLGRSADGPVNLVVGGRVVARGELVVVDGCFGLRVQSVETAERRLTSLGRL